jgi:hypothetical protein
LPQFGWLKRLNASTRISTRCPLDILILREKAASAFQNDGSVSCQTAPYNLAAPSPESCNRVTGLPRDGASLRGWDGPLDLWHVNLP